MSYVQNNLMPTEKVVYEGKLHWFIFVPAGVFLFLSLSMLPGISAEGGGILFSIFLIITIVLAINAFLMKISTELAVTNKRVIAKFGFIRRKTIELSHNKVESFNVDQGIFGRVFNFGTLGINGTGGQKTPIPKICQPLDFRKMAMIAIETGQKSQHKNVTVEKDHAFNFDEEDKLIEALPNDPARPGVLRAKCLKCQKVMAYPEKGKGRNVECPQCKQAFVLP